MEKAMELKFRLAGCLAFGVLIMAMAGPAFAQQKKRVVPPAPAASAAPPAKKQDTEKPNFVVVWATT
jgi:hypothetical protein